MPSPSQAQVSPPSLVTQTPPQETPTATLSESRGSTQTEWAPAKSRPPPNHCLRRGSSHSGRLSDQVSPRSSERNRPPGTVPAQSVPGWSLPPVVSSQMSCVLQG